MVGRHRLLQLVANSCQFLFTLFLALLELLPTADNRSTGVAQTTKLFGHRVDAVLVGDGGVALLRIFQPDGDESLPQIAKTGEKVDVCHGGSFKK